MDVVQSITGKALRQRIICSRPCEKRIRNLGAKISLADGSAQTVPLFIGNPATVSMNIGENLYVPDIPWAQQFAKTSDYYVCVDTCEGILSTAYNVVYLFDHQFVPQKAFKGCYEGETIVALTASDDYVYCLTYDAVSADHPYALYEYSIDGTLQCRVAMYDYPVWKIYNNTYKTIWATHIENYTGRKISVGCANPNFHVDFGAETPAGTYMGTARPIFKMLGDYDILRVDYIEEYDSMADEYEQYAFMRRYVNSAWPPSWTSSNFDFDTRAILVDGSVVLCDAANGQKPVLNLSDGTLSTEIYPDDTGPGEIYTSVGNACVSYVAGNPIYALKENGTSEKYIVNQDPANTWRTQYRTAYEITPHIYDGYLYIRGIHGDTE